MNWQDPRARADRARVTLKRIHAFYTAYPCEAVSLHLLASSAVALGELWAVSESFARIGAQMSPVDDEGQPRTEGWQAYVACCTSGQPHAIRTERWLDAHVADLAAVQDAGLDALFDAELALHQGDPTWQLLADHMHSSLGARHEDALARRGDWAGQSAFATGVMRGMRHLIWEGAGLLRAYAGASARALVWPKQRSANQTGDREAVFILLRNLVRATTRAGLVRRGLRLRARGRVAQGDQWPLLESVLGEEALQVDPLLRSFYSNPSTWHTTAAFSCESRVARWGLELVRRLTGQGLAETRPGHPWPARFHVFAREDGSMHFVREIDCDDQLRVFDSDFVPGRAVDGTPAVVEVFPSLGVTIPLVPIVQHNGDLEMRADQLIWRGISLPRGMRIAFLGQVQAHGGLRFTGSAVLLLDHWLPWMAHRLGVPERLGTLVYDARAIAGSDPSREVPPPESSRASA